MENKLKKFEKIRTRQFYSAKLPCHLSMTTGIAPTMYALCAYLVQINCNNKKLNLSTLKPSTSNATMSLYDILQNMMKTNAKSGLLQKPGEKKVYRHSHPTHDKDGSIYGLIESGEFGYTQEFIETQTKKVSYKKKKTEAGLLPFFIRIAPAKKPHQAILVCQKFKTYGIKSHLNEVLGQELLKFDKNWVITIDKIIPSKLINRYLNDGEVKSIRLISHEKPSDIAEELSQIADDKNSSTVELVVRARRGKSFGQDILGWIKNKKPLTGLLTLPNIQYDTVKADIEIGGKRKILNLTNMQKIGAMIDITDEITLDTKGHPTLASLIDVSGDLIEDIKKEL